MKIDETARMYAVTTVAMTLLLGGLLIAGNVSADIPPGEDCLVTDAGTEADIGPFPSGFFGSSGGNPSDPVAQFPVPMEGIPQPVDTCTCTETVIEFVDVHGNVNNDDKHNVFPKVVYQAVQPDGYDTCIARLANADFSGGIGVPEQVAIEIIELNLVSIDPITVTYGGVNDTLFQVLVTLDGGQPQGELEFTPQNAGGSQNGEILLNDLPLNVRLDFNHVGGPGPIMVAPVLGISTGFAGTTGTFGTVPIPAIPELTVQMVVIGVLGIGICAVFVQRRQRSVS